MRTIINIIILAALFSSLSSFGNERADDAGYTSDNESIERVTADAQWDAEQAEFDKPNP